MGPSAISDLTMRGLQAAMQGHSARRQSFQDNISNVETPGYLASVVSFEDSLRRALQSGRPEQMRVTTSRSLAPTNMNGNNVRVDDEFVGLTENSLRSQLVVEALNAKYRLLRTAITGQ